MDTKFFTTTDGRRGEERVTQVTLEDGTVQNVIERLEEQVPMKVTRKVTQKMISVPVEERTEIYNDDGSVDTIVKSLTDKDLQLDKPKDVSLEDVLNQVKELQNSVYKKETSKVEMKEPTKVGFMDGLRSKFTAKETDDLVVKAEDSNNIIVTVLTYIGWGVVAYLSASIVFHLI